MGVDNRRPRPQEIPMRLAPTSILAAAFALAAVHCGAPVTNTPVNDIPKLTSLETVMDNQATVADPQWKKIGATAYVDADWAAFALVSERIQATSLKTKDFSKGPEFDAFATTLNEKAKALGAAATAKDTASASAALGDMKATCKACHSKFR
jgi:cytochrome c556